MISNEADGISPSKSSSSGLSPSKSSSPAPLLFSSMISKARALLALESWAPKVELSSIFSSIISKAGFVSSNSMLKSGALGFSFIASLSSLISKLSKSSLELFGAFSCLLSVFSQM